MVANEGNLCLLEDAAESMGSFFNKRHVGTFGNLGILSFNGNKLITTGGGGAVLCPDSLMADKAKHMTTTAKKDHKYEFLHDSIGYNYRMPNINAALGVAQLEQLEQKIERKRLLASKYEDFLSTNYKFISE